MKLKDKNVLIYGVSLSGEWASRLCNKLGASVFLYDDNFDELKTKELKNCFIVKALDKELISQFDFIIVSPAIEKDNQYLVMAKDLGIRIYSEIEFASAYCKKYVAVTGTNGKTTTVQLIEAILKKKYSAIACGNIGYPLSRAVLQNKHDIKVVEVSSFMLENAQTFAPHIATITNIAPDHLIRHKTMEEYVKLKKSIYKNLKQKDYAVVNLDLKVHPTVATCIITYSYKHKADVYVKEGCIYLHDKMIVPINKLKITGKHNVYNVMCAICFAYIYKVKPAKISEALLEFVGERFRNEYIAEINKIKFINDSKSTNIASTLASVDSVKTGIILLLGGSKKGLDYSELFASLPKRVKLVVGFGEIADELCVKDNRFEHQTCKNLEESFKFAIQNAKPNDTILLSPASASYDQYKSYVERGNEFNALVRKYEAEQVK